MGAGNFQPRRAAGKKEVQLIKNSNQFIRKAKGSKMDAQVCTQPEKNRFQNRFLNQLLDERMKNRFLTFQSRANNREVFSNAKLNKSQVGELWSQVGNKIKWKSAAMGKNEIKANFQVFRQKFPLRDFCQTSKSFLPLFQSKLKNSKFFLNQQKF